MSQLPLWFEAVTKQTITSSLVLTFLSKEPPVYWNSTRVANDSFSHTPQEHAEKDVENYQQCNKWSRFDMQHVFDHVDEVVERYE